MPLQEAFQKEHCDACGSHRAWTPRVWLCDLCPNYLLCESCHNGQEGKEAGSSSHHNAHRMIPKVSFSRCDSCDTSPIKNQRWHCQVCSDFDLCEACHVKVDTMEISSINGHSKEHLMSIVEVIKFDNVHCYECGIHCDYTSKFWVWKNNVSVYYYQICEDCHNFIKSSEVQIPPESVYHLLVPVIATFSCNGCESFPILETRWDCQVCPNFKLCEACYAQMDKLQLSHGHSKEHSMMSIEFSAYTWFQKSDFSKPMDPAWSYCGENGVLCFQWKSRKPLTRLTTIANGESTQGCKVFLSHAGAQKDFVELLHHDLLKVHRQGVFFDKDNDSLPKGKMFPELIFKAAEECQLAIVVASDEYFSRKWPMLELATFVKKQRKILPIFHPLSLQDFKQTKRQQSYVKSWNQMADSRTSKDASLWINSLKVLPKFNGISMQPGMGQMELRNQIVKAVCYHVAPNCKWDDSNVQGKARMIQVIDEMTQNIGNPSIPIQPCFTIGLHGLGGSGKTTFSKLFCNVMLQKYLGRACYIELGTKDSLKLGKQVLRQVTNLSTDFINSHASDPERLMQLLREELPKQKICLVIDNITDDQKSIWEAMNYLRVPFKKGSMVLIIARSIDVLKKVNNHLDICLQVPALQEHEAADLFIHWAQCDRSKLSEKERILLVNFVNQCRFKVKYEDVGEYHPLALKVLGTHIGSDPQEWENKDIDFKSFSSPMFSILRTNFDTLRNHRSKKMFIDMALNKIGTTYDDLMWQIRFLHSERSNTFFSKWLKELQEKSLIEHFNIEANEVCIHDLYREFAQFLVNEGEMQHDPVCSLSMHGTNNEQSYIQDKRLRIFNLKGLTELKREILCKCAESELLIIRDCSNLTSVDVRNMPNLKVLEIAGCPQLTNLCMDGVVTLQSFAWDCFYAEYLQLSGLVSLERFKLSLIHLGREYDSKTPTEDFFGCSYIQSYILPYTRDTRFSKSFDLNHMRFLTTLHISFCFKVERFVGLKSLSCLQVMILEKCYSLLEFPSLVNFPSLKVLYLTGAKALEELHGFDQSNNLERLSLAQDVCLMLLPGIRACTKLKWLDLSYTNIEDYSWISTMEKLEFIDFSFAGLGSCLPNCSNLHKLQTIILKKCFKLENLGNIAYLQDIQEIDISYCKSLKALPHLNGSALITLNMSHSCVKDAASMDFCLQLQTLDCSFTPITNLPNLNGLQKLKHLDVRGCVALERLDNINNLPALEKFLFDGCTLLIALPDLRRSTCLMELTWKNCPLLDPNTCYVPDMIQHPLENEDNVESYQYIEDQAVLSEETQNGNGPNSNILYASALVLAMGLIKIGLQSLRR